MHVGYQNNSHGSNQSKLLKKNQWFQQKALMKKGTNILICFVHATLG